MIDGSAASCRTGETVTPLGWSEGASLAHGGLRPHLAQFCSNLRRQMAAEPMLSEHESVEGLAMSYT